MPSEPPRRPVPGRPRVAGSRRGRPRPEEAPADLAGAPAVEVVEVVEVVAAEPADALADTGEDGAEEQPTPVTARRRPRPLTAVLAVVALALTAGCVVLGLDLLDRTRTDDARRAALSAAPARLESLLSYDHRTLEADFAEGQAAATGAFRREYGRTTAEVVRDTATRYKAVVAADVVGVAAADASPDQVVVVAFVNQTTTSDRVRGPQVDQSRVRAVLRRVDGEWLVSRLDAL